mgnify:CR=1 FL=1
MHSERQLKHATILFLNNFSEHLSVFVNSSSLFNYPSGVIMVAGLLLVVDLLANFGEGLGIG